MKKTVLLSTLFSSLLLSHSITVKISNVHKGKGQILIGLFNSSDGFREIDSVYKQGIISTVDSTELVYLFTDVPSGVYALSTFHDENKNSKLDKNFLGMPKEGYGFSNNLRPTFRPASFEESLFKLNKDMNITIEMGY